MGLINETVKLESGYDTWKIMFEKEKKALNKIFNKDSFTIEHVGSTAVNGLMSKPIVDIAIGVNDLKDLKKYKDKLEKIYTIKENTNNHEILLIKENEKETFALIHIMPINSKRYQNMIKFRNILIKDQKILKEYENLKIKLSKKYANNRKMYTKSKNEYIQDILKNNDQ